MKKVFFLLFIIFTTYSFSQEFIGRTYWSYIGFGDGGNGIIYSFSDTLFTKTIDTYSEKDTSECFEYKLIYKNKIPFLKYKENSQIIEVPVLYNNDYLFILRKSIQDISYGTDFTPYCSGRFLTNSLAEPIIKNVDYVKYSSVLEEKDIIFSFAPHPVYLTMSPWVPDVKEDKNMSIEFTVYFGANTSDNNIILVNGFVNIEKTYLYEQNSRAKDIEVIFYDTTGKSKTESILLEDTPNPQLIKCPEDFITKNVKIIIKSTYQGSKYSDVAISYIGYVYKK